MAEHIDLGNRGEVIALRYLENNDYIVLERKWRTGHMEIDLIARYGDELIIAEVKSRTKYFLATLNEVVGKRKQNLLIRAANSYIVRMNLDLDVRFDIIIVVFDNGSGFRINHIKNAFYPSVRS